MVAAPAPPTPSSAPASSATLYAVSKHVGLRCASLSAAFMDCKRANPDPAACTAQGTALTGCVVDLLRDAGAKAGPALDGYAACLDYHSNVFRKCRPQQAAFEEAYPA